MFKKYPNFFVNCGLMVLVCSGFFLITMNAEAQQLPQKSEVQPYKFLKEGPHVYAQDYKYHLTTNTNCGPKTFSSVHEWMKIFDVLIPVNISWGGWTEGKPVYNGKNTFSCDSITNLVEDLEVSDRTLAVTRIYYSTSSNLALDRDVILLSGMDYRGTCVIAHELGHVFGLDHSELKDAAMYAYGCREPWLKPDDLLGLADLYDVKPNCTAYLNENLDIYIPHYEGSWYVLQRQFNNSFSLSDSGPSLPGDWACTQEINNEGYFDLEMFIDGDAVIVPFGQNPDGSLYVAEFSGAHNDY